MQRLSWSKWAQVLQLAVWASHRGIFRKPLSPPSAPVSSWLCWSWKLLEAETALCSGAGSSPLPLVILSRRLLLPALRCLGVCLGFVVWACPWSSSQHNNEPGERFSSLYIGNEGSIHLPPCSRLEALRVSENQGQVDMAQAQQEATEQELEATWATAGHQVALNTLFLATGQPLAKQDLGFSSLWSVE